MEWHPYAKLFPLLGADALQALSDDIRENGLNHPIIIDADERIIDGRNRHAACKLAGVDPVFEPFLGSEAEILKLVVSENVHRRHLTDAQRAMVAAEVANISLGWNQHSKEGPPIGGPSKPVTNAEAAEALSVSTRSVERARIIKAKGVPELQEAVSAGVVSISTGEEIARLPADEQPDAVQEIRERPPRHKHAPRDQQAEESSNGIEPLGIGIQRAHEAIACLKKIPKADALRKRAFQLVGDWMKHNK